jgi:hypothetical protein
MALVAGFEHLLKSYDVRDLLDDIASADPPAYLRRCFAEASSAAYLSWARVQQLAVCAMVLDAVVNQRDYEDFEPELLADWRIHYAKAFGKLTGLAVMGLRRAQERDSILVELAAADPQHVPDARVELAELERRLAAV